MPRGKEGYKSYRSGDPIHIVITQDFEEDANRFFTFCREKGYNPSQVIRQAISDWMKRQGTDKAPMASDGQPGQVDPGDKLMDFIAERDRRKARGMSLQSVKELLEEE